MVLKDLKDILINENKSMFEAMQLMDNNGKGILLVVDENNVLQGTITDGDIRRAILFGNQLSACISDICNRNCIYSDENINVNEIRNNFIEKKINLLPIVNENKKVISYFEIDDLIDFNKLDKDNPVLIMAGGLGTRLLPLTENIPKPMLKVGNKPILETIISQFKNYGFKNIFISVNYKADIIENYFKDGKEFGVSIKYIKENRRLGTAGAIKLAEKYLKNPFFVINGDIITNVNFYNLLKYHSENSYKMTIGSRIYETQIPYGVLNIKNSTVTSIDEKPISNYLVSGGVYVLNPELIKNIPENQYFDITQLIDVSISNNEKVGSYPITDYWMDIGKLDDYQKANNDVKNFD